MRRKPSTELPRFVIPHPPSSQWRRRHVLFVFTGLLFVLWLLRSRRACPEGDGINWRKYAYSLYATDGATLCHAVLVFDSLAKLGSKADRVLFYPDAWDTVISDSRDRNSQLLVIARDKYDVKLQPIKLLTVEGRTRDGFTGTWQKSVTKLMAFSLGYYDRVIALDSDITLLKPIDELFLLPDTPIALPRAYWYKVDPPPLTSLLMVIKPNLEEFERFKDAIQEGGDTAIVQAHKFDMELVNERFEHSALVLPHRPYALLSGEFRKKNHTAYLGNPWETWDAQKIYDEAKLVHFSDWPLPKPWIMWPLEGLAEIQPDCGGSHQGTCAERKIWKGLYEDFRARRKDICRLLSVPAPDWSKIKASAPGDNSTEVQG
ncbi:nucleotide-diphospho-sugar transferase [Westerdykella ornata]|uniref:Nucleotide-diphospho-sugar transferase n=1 Tax=Westerdykella ornata TaxID=318751 RepID=A0A6A6JNY4_WESOR|nr:nucleotide-diphospho-sugar transferase [Westerdykella ornata]KAF2278360.1 nucleotide-diphospho-sugar transferase [Westerdykella ornata]